ncbi:S-adenosyl-L-methionine-dependent methyltransferase [Amniculicola lignicola CBS 123094]|uniref:S-adenosyl-L-methionine-dependent methyltransferase n=1 Tax=Amniculicola lignicola CBS 123094 TaxID=1392246 RepID=A0A6A5WFJ9_9PLEO|nr:S-adenosyl-L-methionine-dependent methyltransferase [Amniculicola lignicola CBS 123094]
MFIQRLQTLILRLITTPPPIMTTAELNRKYFDQIADAYDKKPWFAKVHQVVGITLRAHLDANWLSIPLLDPANPTSPSNPTEVRLLDYACGPGTMSRILAPYVTTTLGVDLSPNMVAAYNARAATSDPPNRMSAVVGDLFSTPPSASVSSPTYTNFGLATVGFGFHHFDDPIHAAKCLLQTLRPGGVLLLNEFLQGGDMLADEEGGMVEGSEGDHVKHFHGKGVEHGHAENHEHGHGHAHHHGPAHEHVCDHEHSHEDSDSHGHSHQHPDQGHDHGHGHGHHHHASPSPAPPSTNPSSLDPTFPHKAMSSSIVVPSFTEAGVRDFFSAAGFVDVDVRVVEERVYMEFGGNKIWRTVLWAKGRRPVEEGEKSEL